VVVNRYYKGGSVGVRNLQKLIKAPVFHLLPSDYASLIEAINRGVPLNVVAPRAKLWQSFQGLAQSLAKELLGVEDAPKTGLSSWSRLLKLGRDK
jgi:Flp pilus assembly CpaE family ATPase